VRNLANQIQLIPLDKLVPHPANPNRMSKANFAKLVRNIERTGRYEPLIVRTCKQQDCFQIINGHHRALALKQLGKKEADAIIWDIDDDEADILLATLNRLCGQDILDRKLTLLKRLSEKMQTAELAKLLPQTKKQIEKLRQLAVGDCRLLIDNSKLQIDNRNSEIFLNPLVFFVSDEQQQVVETAINYAISSCVVREAYCGKEKATETIRNTRQTKAAKRASALSAICQYYLDHKFILRSTTTENGQAQIKTLLGFKE
jgi:hypothetical protein